MTSDEIKLRQLAGQHLLARTDTLTAAENLLGIQAQFMSNVLHSLRLRCGSTGTVGLVKNWTVRGTIHVFAAADLPLFLSCGEHCREDRWDIPSFWNRRSDWTLTPRRQEYLSRVILDALAEAPRSREELKAVCRAAGMTEAEESSMFHPWGGGIRELSNKKRRQMSPLFLSSIIPQTSIKININWHWDFRQSIFMYGFLEIWADL